MLNLPRTFGSLPGPIPTSYLDNNFLAIAQTFVGTIAELRTIPKTGSGIAFTYGYYSAGDGASGLYRYNPTDTTSTDNGGTIIVASDGGRWYLVYNNVYVENFGALGDNSHDDTAAIQAAINSFGNGDSGILNFDGTKTYLVTSQLANNNRNLIFEFNGCTVNLNAAITYLFSVNGSGCVFRDGIITKPQGLAATAFYVTGIRHIFDNMKSGDCVWANFWYLQDCKESHFTKNRIDLDVSNLTGNIFKCDYSVNNTFSDNMFGFCAQAVFCTSTTQPVSGYSCEGFTFTNLITVFAGMAINCDRITSLGVTNSVLDFNGTNGVFVTNGQVLFVVGSWIAIPGTGGIAIGTSTNFSNAVAIANSLIGNSTLTNSIALSFACPFGKPLFNHINNLNAGVVNNATAYDFGNTLEGTGTALTGSRGGIPGTVWFSGNTFIRQNISDWQDSNTTGTNILASQFGNFQTMGILNVAETGTTNFLIATFFKNGTAGVPQTAVIQSSVLSISSANANGTVAISGASVPANLKFETQFKKMSF